MLVFPPRKRFAGRVLLLEVLVPRGVGVLPGGALGRRHAVEGGLHPFHVPFLLIGGLVAQAVELEVVDECHAVGDAHLLRMGRFAAGGVIVVERGRIREFHVVVEVEVFLFGHPVAVRRFVVDEEAEGFRRVAVFEEVDGVIRRKVRGIAFTLHVLAVRFRTFELGVVIFALVPEHLVIIEPLRFALHVPFAYDGRLIPRLAKEFGEERLRGIDARTQLPLPVLVAVKSGHEACAAGRRERVLDKCLAEEHPFGRQPVEVRRRGELAQGMPVSA